MRIAKAWLTIVKRGVARKGVPVQFVIVCGQLPMAERSPSAVTKNRSASASSSSYSNSSPLFRSPENKGQRPQVEIGAPCLRCHRGCEGLLLHVWRKVCVNCGCPRDTHQLQSTPLHGAMDQLGLEEGKNYRWCPHGISMNMVEDYMKCLPEDHVPLIGTIGEMTHARLYLNQLPSQDFNPDACHKLTDIEQRRLVKFADRRRTKASGVGTVLWLSSKEKKICAHCSEKLTAGVCVTAERAGPEKAWHPACFRCKVCKEILVELAYYYNEENKEVYCGRHYAELKVPRCFGCDELIFSDSYTEAEGKNWHKEHFCCEKCDKPLQGKNYGEKDGTIYCNDCYTRYAAHTCCRCLLPVALGSKQVSKNGKYFHSECFVCKRCRESLYERKYYEEENDFLCNDCLPPTIQCSVCKLVISPTVKYLKHESRAWHTECFHCASCRQSLIDQGFNIYDSNLMCKECFADKTCQKCVECQKPILGKAIQFNYTFYHSDCFCCHDCKGVLTGGKVHEKHGAPYCNTCVLKFATRCAECNQPITSKHTLYKRQAYHIACFKCSKCGIPIGSASFYETSLEDVLCEKCAV